MRAAAAELPRPITLPEALEVLALIARSEPERYPRAAARFAGRAALERDDLELREIALLVAALEHPGHDLLERICRALNLS